MALRPRAVARAISSTDSDGEREEHHHCKAGIPDERTHSPARIARECLHERQPAYVPVRLAQLRNPSQLQARLTPGLRLSEASTLQVVLEHPDVRIELLLEVISQGT